MRDFKEGNPQSERSSEHRNLSFLHLHSIQLRESKFRACTRMVSVVDKDSVQKCFHSDSQLARIHKQAV